MILQNGQSWLVIGDIKLRIGLFFLVKVGSDIHQEVLLHYGFVSLYVFFPINARAFFEMQHSHFVLRS